MPQNTKHIIPVTKPFFAPINEYQQKIKKIWQNEWITNHGPLVLELEQKLKLFLNVKNLLFVSNGTIALQIAIKALNLKGQIITTPYTYVATTSSIVWEGCTPIFVDINPSTLNINVDLIEAAITPSTSAILATHIYGNPCDVEAIEKIAKKHHLKVIYDAAHAFGVKIKGKSIFEYGDISTTSFHATKLFHTAEGGAVFTKNKKLHNKMSLLRNFGHTSPTTFDGVGINGKNSELHAAIGLCNLKYAQKIMAKRKQQFLYYFKQLQGVQTLEQQIHNDCTYNFAYFPLVLATKSQKIKVLNILKKNNVIARQYYNPSLSTLNYVQPQP
ncbi:MAG: DegT/DnrJ/EryC1/StrS family aminotransferase, partial [Ferruginibacter sp.]|nr:DegT/DnrJ/EryC1/StrS family aminotransferase [Ferruginibacter sp.]